MCTCICICSHVYSPPCTFIGSNLSPHGKSARPAGLREPRSILVSEVLKDDLGPG